MSLTTVYAERIQTIINEIRAQLPSLPEPQRTQAEQHLAEMEHITSEMVNK